MCSKSESRGGVAIGSFPTLSLAVKQLKKLKADPLFKKVALEIVPNRGKTAYNIIKR